MSVPRKKCPKCGKGCDQFDNCWECIRKKKDETRKSLVESLNQVQKQLFKAYEEAKDKWTSIIIRD